MHRCCLQLQGDSVIVGGRFIRRIVTPDFVRVFRYEGVNGETQQADILTSELWAIRRTVQPVIEKICRTFLALEGLDNRVEIEWDDISLQDITEEAKADLYRAQAAKYLVEAQGG